jgi:hypothetical protein
MAEVLLWPPDPAKSVEQSSNKQMRGVGGWGSHSGSRHAWQPATPASPRQPTTPAPAGPAKFHTNIKTTQPHNPRQVHVPARFRNRTHSDKDRKERVRTGMSPGVDREMRRIHSENHRDGPRPGGETPQPLRRAGGSNAKKQRFRSVLTPQADEQTSDSPSRR